ncbi:DUF4132 domain-containing protein [Ramlibacter sp. WS9]|uniref:DUF4132 domain-containing protein n=1 Tax=Ramlibacter sp. WS9 TaxID=1882741 RepID=UPI00116BFE12|nr:DUF4132 domain-containing protein [Ramlibacter sp. WS9]ROZ74312.1 DUF4132 domain-containing protein [Ramlibacter sp. WS9]
MTMTIPWPDEGLLWDEAWTDKLPAFRGLCAPPPPGPPRYPELVSLLVSLRDAHPAIYEMMEHPSAEMLHRLGEAAGQPWTPWWRIEEERITPEALQQADPAAWLELLAQARSLSFSHPYPWAVDACLQLHGFAFALDRVLALWVVEAAARDGCVQTSGPDVLRNWLAGAADAEHEAALAAAESQRQRDPVRRLACAWLFPHRADWARDALADRQPAAAELLATCAVSPVDFEALQPPGGFFGPQLLQLRLHGRVAFDPLARRLEHELAKGRAFDKTLEMLCALRVPALVHLLVRHIEHPKLKGALDALAVTHPAAALHAAIERQFQAPTRTLEPWLLALGDREPAALALALANLDDGSRARFEVRQAQLQRSDSPQAAARALLANPPWERGVKAPKLPVLELASIATEERIHWPEGQQERVLAHPPRFWSEQPMADNFPVALGLRQEGRSQLLAGEPLRPADVEQAGRSTPSLRLVMLAPETTRVQLWNSWPGPWEGDGQTVIWLRAHYGIAALPGLAAYVQQKATTGGLYHADDVESPRLVPLMMQVLRHQKKERPRAMGWLRRFARTALFQALPLAFQRAAGKPREDARHAVRWLAREGQRALVLEVAAAYGDAMVEAATALLDEDPLLVLPARMPPLPDFLRVHALPWPALRGGEPLPLGAVGVVVQMLAISSVEARYAGLDLVKQACTPASLADFAWGLFEQWLTWGGNAGDNWAFWGLALLGDDECVRKLAPLVLKWPSEGSSARAAQAIELLAAIGSDVALTHLDAIASKAKTPALRGTASTKIQAIAEARELTREQLADRLVPRLGLDVAGADVLDFGPRRFTLHFDETLKPFVKDGAGKRLKDLPKPAANDDAELTDASTRRYKAVKKDSKLIADQQVKRLERAMATRRRWTGEEFRTLLIGHPVLRHLVARLAWAVFEGEELQCGFRVAEDWSLADDRDATFTLTDDATVALPHPLEFGPERLRRLQDLFSDYEVLQPFKQLTRETYLLTEAERETAELTRFRDRVVVCASVLNLANKGWQATGADGGGWISELTKPFGEVRIDFRMEPGTIVGNPLHEPKQRIPEIRMHRNGATADSSPTFASLDMVSASELLRDFELLPLAADVP